MPLRMFPSVPMNGVPNRWIAGGQGCPYAGATTSVDEVPGPAHREAERSIMGLCMFRKLGGDLEQHVPDEWELISPYSKSSWNTALLMTLEVIGWSTWGAGPSRGINLTRGRGECRCRRRLGCDSVCLPRLSIISVLYQVPRSFYDLA